VRLSKAVPLIFLAFTLSWAPALHAQPPRSTSTVGMPAKIEQTVLPGTELEAKPIEDRQTPLVLRVVATYPHGSAFRYDLVYYGLEPGTYDLRDYLRRKDGSSAQDLPTISVLIEPVLRPGQIEPNRLALTASPFVGGYRVLLLLGGLVWVLGLAAIVLVGRRKRRTAAKAALRPVTLADRIRPLVDAALAGRLSAGQHAELERLLIGYWRKRLNLEHAAPAQFMGVLRAHDEAGALLRRLEDWLHRPDGAAAPVDVAALLKPYQAISAEELQDGDAEIATSAPSPSERRA
jgi:hypothetical protein